eukprot:446855-Prorocentrum_minimum.AAC.2
MVIRHLASLVTRPSARAPPMPMWLACERSNSSSLENLSPRYIRIHASHAGQGTLAPHRRAGFSAIFPAKVYALRERRPPCTCAFYGRPKHPEARAVLEKKAFHRRSFHRRRGETPPYYHQLADDRSEPPFPRAIGSRYGHMI